MPNEYWWNADFDLALRPDFDPSTDQGLTAQVRELALHALTAANPEDSILLHEAPPSDFLQYLEHRGVVIPKLSIMPEIRAGHRFRPYGCSPQAFALNDRYNQPTPMPSPESVRRVNGRSFAHRIELDSLESVAPLGSFISLVDLHALLVSAPPSVEGWIAKTEHGNAALGNRRIRNRQLQPEVVKWLSARLKEGPMVLERWLERSKDLCTVFEVTPEGRVEGLTFHETIHTSDGGFIGALYDRETDIPAEWRETLSGTAETVASELAKHGYFGPVCADALVWNDQGTSKIRSLVDLNARRHASEGWRRLADLWGGCLYGRFFSTRKLRLPPTYEEFEESLGSDAWHVQSRTGTLQTSPMWLEGQGNRRRPRKLGVVFRGNSREAVLRMEAHFRKVFER